MDCTSTYKYTSVPSKCYPKYQRLLIKTAGFAGPNRQIEYLGALTSKSRSKKGP